MASTKKSLSARIAAGFGAVAVATAAVLGGALPATAADNNINPGARGSITIHKFEEPTTASGLANNGTELPSTAGLTAVAGVHFTVQPVTGIDLSTNQGWTDAAALTAGAAASRVGTGSSTITGQDGVAEFTDLSIGVYLVTETSVGINNVAIKAEPFLVSIPMPVNNAWLYDVHVYPKNSMTSITKSLDDSTAYGLGDQVTWSISVKVPEVAANDTLDEFVITDVMDSRLAFVSGSLALTIPGAVATDPRQDVALAYGTHYKLVDNSTYSVEFLPAGLTLLAAQSGAQVEIQAVTRVSNLGEDGNVSNTATLRVNGNEFATTPVSTHWRTLSILKFEGDDQTAVLAGAEFQVFRSQADAEAKTNAISVLVDGETVSTFVTQDDGIALVPGLRADVTYYVVETKAPVGYRIDQRVQEWTVKTDHGIEREGIDVRLSNSQVPAYELPITGGTGQAAFMIGGFGLLAGALGFMLIRRRKAQADA